jgi:exodeoxyribonuclease VII large subunit
MTAYAAPPVPGRNLPEYTVSELSAALKRTVEDSYAHVRVRGEISGFKRHSSGHLYMALKDADAVLDAVCWRGTVARLGLKPEDGMEVIATGRLTTYPGRSKYQIVIEAMELAGEGALLKLLEERRKKLAAEGLFDSARKKPLPFLPEIIGVVTSPTGAVIRDILHRLRDRFPRHVLLWPVAVQGEGAAAQIAAAIEGFNRLAPGGPVPRPDLLIVARGGGSLEDLWAFNEEIVVRAAAASAIPLIAAVGHETDVTLIDFAADRRAPTPTAAAEMAVPVRAELLAAVIDHERRMVGGWARYRDEKRVRLEGLARGLPDPRRLLEAAMQRLDDRAERLVNARKTFLARRADDLARVASGIRKATLETLVTRADDRLAHSVARFKPAVIRLMADLRRRLDHAGALLESYSYERVLERGFALVSDAAGHPVTSAATLAPGMQVGLRFRDGAAEAQITRAGGGVAPAKPEAAKAKPTKAKSPGNGKQGRLL